MPTLNGPVAGSDLVLGVEAEFLDVGVAVEGVVAAAAGEVVGQQVGVERAADRGIVGDIARRGALSWAGEAGQRVAISSTQGELKVELTMASGSFSRRRSASTRRPTLKLLTPFT